jgi:uncharacterized membrane protein YphA (DoxX/SURF4 family)
MSRVAETPRWVRTILRVPLIWPAARLALVSAFLIGGLTKLSDFSAAIAEQEHFIELGGSALVMLGWQVWLGAGGLGVLTAVAMLTANDFWHLTGHDRFMALNAFFEHLGLIAGLVIVSIHAGERERI